MYLAYVMTKDRGAMEPLLTAFAEKCIRAGHRIAGIVQSNTPRPDTHHCDMDVKVLPDGPVFRISQSLGKEARGCRLEGRQRAGRAPDPGKPVPSNHIRSELHFLFYLQSLSCPG